ncbi:sphinganine C4-monooxygenase 2-like isoform X2 [Typha latifolia]|uniref:sphinganine C4-monooxygenase 2-like isoform X2 n=1 Tax=Typha latifolia TaxID=4733 RepID=UPI003C2FEC4F
MKTMISDELLGAIVPIIVYWVYSGMYEILGNYLEKYRLHTKSEEDSKNTVSKSTVVKGVVLQQAFQFLIAFILLTVYFFSSTRCTTKAQPSLVVKSFQFLIAMGVLDTEQYFMHRYMHTNKMLYKYVHSKHHRLVVPYAFGALYNHPLEGLLLDTFGGALAFLVSGMTPRTAVFFFSFATIKTVDDHCGLWMPSINVLHAVFGNNSAYHDVHHQFYGSKFNFSQPFFVTWDRILGTYMPYSIHKRQEGGFEARPIQTSCQINDHIYI